MSLQLFESMRVVTLPLRSKFRGITTREVALFKGEYGWGEFSPFLEYSPEESVRWLKSAIEAATTPPPIYFRKTISVNATLPAIDSPDEITRILSGFPGCNSVKIKVGEEIDKDIARIKTVKEFAPSAKIRIDVNGGWSVKGALSNIAKIQSTVGSLQYVEQPVASLEELRELKTALKGEVLITGDEILRKSKNPFEVDLSNAVDILMLKVSPLGGIQSALKLADHHKLPVVVSSALESAIGISAGLKLAAALPELNFDCGLATGSLLLADVGLHEIKNGEILVKDVEPIFEGVEVSPDRYKWWQDRVMKTWELIA
jgi:O-succinylbenzoate synthase